MIKNNLASLADESITKLFKSPEKNICEQKEFVSVLAKLDERLKYMQTNVRKYYFKYVFLREFYFPNISIY
jgi:hypothetical protein